MQAVQDDPAANPQHGDGPDEGQRRQQVGHRIDEKLAERLRPLRGFLAQVQPDIVELHDQRHRAIDHQRHGDADNRQHARADDKILGRDFVQRDRHDLGRQDQVGADRPGNALLFECHRIDDLVFDGEAVLLPAELLHDLLRAFVGEVGAARHQDEEDRAGQQPAQQ